MFSEVVRMNSVDEIKECSLNRPFPRPLIAGLPQQDAGSQHFDSIWRSSFIG
jgi:hypothetical protein